MGHTVHFVSLAGFAPLRRGDEQLLLPGSAPHSNRSESCSGARTQVSGALGTEITSKGSPCNSTPPRYLSAIASSRILRSPSRAPFCWLSQCRHLLVTVFGSSWHLLLRSALLRRPHGRLFFLVRRCDVSCTPQTFLR